MAKTNAQKQADYRLRQLGKPRLNTWISEEARTQLDRLLRFYEQASQSRVTKRQIVEMGLHFLDKSCQMQMSPDDLACYLGQPRKKRAPGP